MPKKGENIYKRKDNRWEARYIKGHHPDGTPQYGYCYAKTYREVKQKLNIAKATLISGIPTNNILKKRRFVYYCDEWLQINRNRFKNSTYAKYNTALEKHIKPHLGGYLVQSLSTVTIEQFSNKLLCVDNLSPKSVKDILTLLHSIIKYAYKQIPETTMPLDIIYPKVPKKEMRVLALEEQTRLMEYLITDMDECKFGVLLALLTGMRLGEVCALKWGNLSLENRTIKVASTMQRLKTFDDTSSKKTTIIISEPKSNTSVRTIPLTSYAAKLCQAHYCSDPDAFVLTGVANSYIEPRALQYKFNRYTKTCNLEGVHFHTLRHTFATRCVEVDFEIKSLSEILGHASPRITLERYVHSSLELKRNNMKKLTSIGF